MANVVEIVIKAVDQTKQGFTMPIRNAGDLGIALDKLKPAFLTLAATAATTFGIMAKHSIDAADEMGKLAQKAGESVESFSSMAYAASLSDVEAGALAKGIKELSLNIVEATKAGSDQEKMFEELGVKVTDQNGKLRTASAVLLDVSTRFADTADGIGKTTMATKLFGSKLGPELIPFLNQGANGIRELQSEAESLGQTFTGETAAASEQFNDNLSKLKLAAQGVVNQVVAQFIPSIAALSEEFVGWVKESGIVNAIAWTLIDTFKIAAYAVKLMITAVSALEDVFVGIGKTIGDIASTFVSFWELMGSVAGHTFEFFTELLQGHFENAKEIAKTSLGDIQSDFNAFGENVKMIGVDAAAGFKNAFKTLAEGPLAPTLGQGPDIKITKFADSGAKKPQMPFLQDDSQVTKFAENAIRQLKRIEDMRAQLVQESLRGTSAEIGAEDEKYRKQLEQIDQLGADEDNFYALREQAFHNHQQRLLEIEAGFFEQRRRLQVEMTANIAGGDTAIRIQEDERYKERLQQIAQLNLAEEDSLVLTQKAAEEHSAKRREIFNQELQAVSGAFGQMAEAAKAFGKKGFEAYKAFAIAQAIIDTYTGATAAYKSLAGIPFVGPVLGVAAAGAAIAAGLARVATIKSTQPGVAHAGLDYVPEEATYILQHGERVLAPRQNEDLTEFLAHGGGGPAHVTMILDGRVIGEVVGRLSRDGRLQIDSRAVTTR